MKSVFVYEYLSAHGPEALPGVPADEASDLLDQGRAMRDALRDDLCRCGLSVGHAVAADEPAPPGRAGDPTRSTPLRAHSGETPQALLARAAQVHDRLWIIAPETDDLLASLSAGLPAARRVGCGLAALRLASRKTATRRHLAAAGVATPERLAALPDGAAGGRRGWIVKPDDGAGGLDTVLHDTLAAAEADLESRTAAGRPATLEPYVDGEAMSLSLLCCAGAVELLAINRQHVHVEADGRLRYDGVAARALPLSDLRAPALRSLARQVVRAVPGLGGYVGIDLVWHAVHGPVVIEINPRLTSAWPGLQAALDRPLAAEVLAVPVDDGVTA